MNRVLALCLHPDTKPYFSVSCSITTIVHVQRKDISGIGINSLGSEIWIDVPKTWDIVSIDRYKAGLRDELSITVSDPDRVTR